MNRLFIRQCEQWQDFGDFPTYRDAVYQGQALAPGNFMVDTGPIAPTREQQLLLEPKPKKKSYKDVLNQL